MATETTYSPGSNRQAGITFDEMVHGELARTRLTHLDNCNNEILLAREDFSFAPDGRALSVRTTNTVTVNVDYIWLDHLPVAQFQDSYDSTGTYIATETTYLHPDHLGTPRIGTDAARNITWRYRSDAFGIAELSGTATVRLRFPGQLNLGAEGFNYNYFRDYRPETGRYLESDPIGLDGGLNTYAYVGANPLSRVDPNGENWWMVIPGIVLAYEALSEAWDMYQLQDCIKQCVASTCNNDGTSRSAGAIEGDTRPNLACRQRCTLKVYGKPNGPGPLWPARR